MEQKQIDIFGNEIPVEPFKIGGRKHYKRMQELHGFTEGKTCKTCKHLICHRRSRRWYKCGLWIVSSSQATDIRLKDKACGKYEEIEKENNDD